MQGETPDARGDEGGREGRQGGVRVGRRPGGSRRGERDGRVESARRSARRLGRRLRGGVPRHDGWCSARGKRHVRPTGRRATRAPPALGERWYLRSRDAQRPPRVRATRTVRHDAPASESSGCACPPSWKPRGPPRRGSLDDATYLDSPECCVALAAAEVSILRAQGMTEPRAGRGGVGRQPRAPPGRRHSPREVVAAVKRQSELRDLWEETLVPTLAARRRAGESRPRVGLTWTQAGSTDARLHETRVVRLTLGALDQSFAASPPRSTELGRAWRSRRRRLDGEGRAPRSVARVVDRVSVVARIGEGRRGMRRRATKAIAGTRRRA